MDKEQKKALTDSGRRRICIMAHLKYSKTAGRKNSFLVFSGFNIRERSDGINVV